MAETINEVGDDLSTRAREAPFNFAMLTCSWCDEEAFPADPEQVAKLVSHCTYDHASHVPILGVRYDVFVEGYDLALRLGAPAHTEHEQKWRDARG